MQSLAAAIVVPTKVQLSYPRRGRQGSYARIGFVCFSKVINVLLKTIIPHFLLIRQRQIFDNSNRWTFFRGMTVLHDSKWGIASNNKMMEWTENYDTLAGL